MRAATSALLGRRPSSMVSASVACDTAFWKDRSRRERGSIRRRLSMMAPRMRGVVHRWRYGFQRNIYDLQDAELHILLQGSGRAEGERTAQFGARLGAEPIPLETIRSGMPAGTKWPTHRRTLIFTR
jgi:hypothetical protein